MKKYIKLLLLGGIFTLIGIFNFSSAYTYNDIGSFVFEGSSPSTRSYHSLLCDGNNLVYDNVCYEVFPVGDIWNFYFKKPGGDINLVNSVGINCVNLPSNTCLYSQTNFVLYGAGFDGTVVKLYQKVSTLPGGDSSFTPIITGLTNSVNEFIPYVAYIGIGLLTAVIGFVAIKRLINWVRAKIFSSFKR